jgi:short-subunit dehydrogenase
VKVVFLGATKGIGRSLARLMAERGDRLLLLGRDPRELERSAKDLEVRGAPPPVHVLSCDLAKPETFAETLDKSERLLGGLETVVVTAGIFATQETLETDSSLTGQVLTIDFTNTVLFCEEVRRRLVAIGGGTLCVFSSVAGDRGRKPGILYGASKAGLSHYLEGLDHKFRAAGLKTICVKPGFVKTGMTAGLKPPPFAGEPDAVAKTVLKAIDRGKPVVYAPPIWRWIMFVIRYLPRFVMRKIKF